MALTVRLRLVRRSWQRFVFTTAVLLALGLIGLNASLLLRPDLFEGILKQNVIGGAASHFKTSEHRVHDVAFGLLYGTGAVGLLAQLRAPKQEVAGQLMALIPRATLALIFPLTRYWLPFGTDFQMYATAVYGGFTLSAVLLHPSGGDLRGAFRHAPPNRRMLVLAGLAAVPLLASAVTNIGLQRNDASGDIHWQLGHYGFMAALSLTMLGVSVLASLRPAGSRVAWWSAGGLAILLGALSLGYPDVSSSLSSPWALASVAWGLAFITQAEFSSRGAGAAPARRVE